MKFSYTKNTESEFFIKNPNLTKNKKTNSGGWEGRGWGVARVSDLVFLFSKEFKSEIKIVFFLRG